MSSIWSETISIPHRAALAGELESEAVVIGGGLAGVLIAHELQELGVETVLLEANRLGSGQTGHTTAKVTSQHGLIYRRLVEDFGEERAKAYAKANEGAIQAYRTLIAKEGIDCDWAEKPAYLYATANAVPLREEAGVAARLGIRAQFVTALDLPFPVAGALRFDGQAQFHPLKLLKALAAPLRVYEGTGVVRVEEGRVYTASGLVRAKHVVFATHFPFVNAPGYYFLRLHQERSYVLALEGVEEPRGMYLGVERGGLSLRGAAGCLLLGGGGHRTGENEQGGRYDGLRAAAGRYWPQGREVAHWSAQDCIPMDGVPYIGRFSPERPHWYVATGFQKWGMTSSMVAAKVIGRLITQGEADEGVFAPHRFVPAASAAQLLKDGGQAVAGLTRGAIAAVTGKRRCPHLGCELTWNADEESWDCPCHGSRFDREGGLLDGPAQCHMKGGSREE